MLYNTMSNAAITIKILEEADQKVARELNELMEHLTSGPRPVLTPERLGRILSSPQTTLFVAEQEGTIVGSLTLLGYTTPVCNKFWIEDVVTAPQVRGRGVGRQLLREAILRTRQLDPEATIYLTSNPQRIAARELYRSEGFEQYETGVFRLTIKK